MSKPMIFHIDVNSAYLSWEAVYRLQHGSVSDLRTLPAIVGGSIAKRHGIVLAKSIPAKKYHIQTGEPVVSALQKCPHLVSVPPNYNLYLKCSNSMFNILKNYSPSIQRYSIDECFLDYSHMDKHFGKPMDAANDIKTKIFNELGFTVNIGISTNKLLAKMASDFKKPYNIHTLFPYEIKDKMWTLPISDLFMLGKSTVPKLHKLGIYTIGQLATYDRDMLYKHLKSHGLLLWNYANGIDNSSIKKSNCELIKSIGNSTTIKFDVTEAKTAHKVLLSLTENVCMRLRMANFYTNLISISIKTNDFISSSHQRKLLAPTNYTTDIFNVVKELFNERWNGMPIRKLGVRISELQSTDFIQTTVFDDKKIAKHKALDKTIDNIRKKHGRQSVIRATFLNSGIRPITGRLNDSDY